MRALRIAIVVHGRFHAFDLARELIAQGHDVTLFTNYPASVVARFGIDRSRVRSFVAHGVATRLARALHDRLGVPFPDASAHRAFGRWAAAQIACERWDLVHCWTSVAEEVLPTVKGRVPVVNLMRGSAHIRAQARILEEESRRVGVRLDAPSRWMIDREVREYELAERIVVLSGFARDSFVDEGVSPSKLTVLPLGVDVSRFRLSEAVVEERCRRIEAGEPLRVLYVGAISYRKGLADAADIVRSLRKEPFSFRFVGSVMPEARAAVRELSSTASFVPHQPQYSLPESYAWADVFMFPSIEDGFAVVLSQAQASALPILSTTNCAGPDMIRDDANGWILPIRSPESFVERLRWCDRNRSRVAAMVRDLRTRFEPRDWRDVASDFARQTHAILNRANPVKLTCHSA